MSAKSNYELCIQLLEAESEDEVIDILQQADYWENNHVWRKYGDLENNWSAIGNQQSNPVAALVEKLVNAIDAVLIRECYLKDIYPESNLAPQSIEMALEEFFGIEKGNLAKLGATRRNELATQIGLIATGQKQNPNYIVFDLGEGQTPKSLPDTILSISKSNKLKIPFVQGKFNMGGTGALPFCGRNNLQLVISRKHPDIGASDESHDYWGFSIVRREEPYGGRRSSMFTYLAPQNNILQFKSSTIEIPVPNKGTQKIPGLEWGTIIKLYEYEMIGYKTNIVHDLNYRIALMLPKAGLPVRFYERRGYRGHTLETTMNGLHVRLEEDTRDNLEEGFPAAVPLRVKGEDLPTKIYAFKKGKSAKYKTKEGILFSINGQTHGIIDQRFFTRKSVGFGYIADELLVLVDATGISGRTREDLFMNSRDRVRRGELFEAIEDALETALKEHPGLRQLQERRRREAIEERLTDEKPLADVLNEIMRKSPTLSQLFIRGQDIRNPFKPKHVGEEEVFKGERYPTFFRILPRDVDRECQFGRRFRVQFETDAKNDYFMRDDYQGSWELYLGSSKVSTAHPNLWNGIATLNVTLPDGIQVGDELDYFFRVTDDTQIEPFDNEFKRTVVEFQPSDKNAPGNRKPPSGANRGNREQPDSLQLPHVTEVREEDWDIYGFDKKTALTVISVGDSVYDFFINLDNVYLRTELKGLSAKEDPQLVEAQFKYAMVLIGLSLLNEYSHQDDETGPTPEDMVYSITSALAPVIVPLIDTLGSLTLEDVLEG